MAGDFLGQADDVRDTIDIAEMYKDRKISHCQKQETLLHEILHHIDYKYSIGIGEKKIKTLCPAIFQVLRDNKLNFYRR